jgi:hypothetical protein
MRSLFWLAFVLFGVLPAGVRAQTATVIESTTSKQSYTFANTSGFSITNNGTMAYNGPLNQLSGSPCCISATLTVNGESILISPQVYERDTGLVAKTEGGNTLSTQLSEAVIPVRPGVNNIALQYPVVIGGVTRVGRSDSFTIQEKVDGQSLSIFPQFQPSVFP